jgi:hypothetical protein
LREIIQKQKKNTTGKKPKSCGVFELGQSYRAWAKLV